ncbi:MAG: hypothetical protein ACJA0N_001217 [Pseudohongiellaceae bacterium]|jgi:hypothetical protein
MAHEVIKMDKLDIRVALSVFDKVLSLGVRNNDTYSLDGLDATPSFDGYTVTLSDNKVSLHIQFHNKFNLEYDSTKSLNEFMTKLDRFDQSY